MQTEIRLVVPSEIQFFVARLKSTDVSKVHVASISSVEEQAKQGTSVKENGGSTFLRNFGRHLPDCSVL
jgi:hypothetical protein